MNISTVQQDKNLFTDDGLQEWFLYDRLVAAYRQHKKLIIAYDLDDTVRPYYSKNCEQVKALIRRAKFLLNPYFVVYTANPNTEKNIAFLESENLPYDAINQNIDIINDRFNSGKIYYNLFLDDKAGLREAYMALNKLCDYIELYRKGVRL